MATNSSRLVLLADDSPEVLTILDLTIRNWGYRTALARTKTELMDGLSREQPTLVILDLNFGNTDGLEQLDELRVSHPHLPVAILTGNGNHQTAKLALQRGAYDFLSKPPDRTHLRVLISHAAEKQDLTVRIRQLESQADPSVQSHHLAVAQPEFPDSIQPPCQPGDFADEETHDTQPDAPSLQAGHEALSSDEQHEKQAIITALSNCGGSIRDAARSLSQSQAVMYRKLKHYAINLGDYAKPIPS